MKVPNKTPQQMVEFWEAELAELEEEGLKGITMWGRNFLQAKIQIWKEVSKMWVCRKCKSEWPNSVKKCPYCGKKKKS